ncbi:hypothetical protein V8F06_008810 [Rhypophila decipiens]
MAHVDWRRLFSSPAIFTASLASLQGLNLGSPDSVRTQDPNCRDGGLHTMCIIRFHWHPLLGMRYGVQMKWKRNKGTDNELSLQSVGTV